MIRRSFIGRALGAIAGVVCGRAAIGSDPRPTFYKSGVDINYATGAWHRIDQCWEPSRQVFQIWRDGELVYEGPALPHYGEV